MSLMVLSSTCPIQPMCTMIAWCLHAALDRKLYSKLILPKKSRNKGKDKGYTKNVYFKICSL